MKQINFHSPFFLYFGKTIFLFFVGFYILVFPIDMVKFGLHDTTNLFISKGEFVACLAVSFISFLWCGKTVKKLIKEIKTNEG